ncbi:MAG TPA: GAF domain-containing sensor histidine kinase [Gemmatimonadaceae bacterium]
MIQRANDRTEPPIVDASIGKHLALAPVAFAVIEADTHTVLYANALFRHLQSVGQIRVGDPREDGRSPAPNLAPLLDDAARTRHTIRDVILESPHGEVARWSCTIWPVADLGDAPRQLVVEVRNVEMIEGAKQRQRAVAQELLLGALRAQDAAGDAAHASKRSRFLADASRDLSLSLDESTTRETMQHLTLPRPETWCIVDVVESNGTIHRLAAIHPDPAKQALARQLESRWPAGPDTPVSAAGAPPALEPSIVTEDSPDALMRAAHGEQGLRILREIGFGSLLVVPLVVRARVEGTITFVSAKGDPPFSSDEIELAVDLGARCAMALQSARLYREADMLRLAAETANKSKSQFLRTISHELRTPLNAIGGFAELIEMGIEGPVTEKQRAALARIKANQRHLLTLITEILSFVRIESGRLEYRLGRVSLTQALADVSVMLSLAAEQKKLTLTTAAAQGDEDVVAWADSDRVRQILLNLVMNAVKYTPAGGTITMSCASVGGNAVARVADTGPGIEPKQLESIFEPFVQVTTGLTDQGGGVGLGLAISRDLARAMQGDLTVESTIGSGSSFTLSLPLASQAQSATDAAA